FDHTGPEEIEGQGEFPPVDAVWNTCTKYRINLKYQERDDGHRGRPFRYPQRHQMDRHRWLGLGGPRRVRRLQSRLERDQAAPGKRTQSKARALGQSLAQLPGRGEIAPARDYAGGSGA